MTDKLGRFLLEVDVLPVDDSVRVTAVGGAGGDEIGSREVSRFTGTPGESRSGPSSSVSPELVLPSGYQRSARDRSQASASPAFWSTTTAPAKRFTLAGIFQALRA